MNPFLTRVEEASSTNDLVRAKIEAECADGLAIWSSNQRSGRGRRGRSWVCPSGKGVAMSVALVGAQHQRNMLLMPLATGVAVARVCAEQVSETFGLKWPNDVLHEGRKVAGILCEGVMVDGRFRGVVVGVGVNVNAVPSDFPAELQPLVAGLRSHRVDDIELGGFAGRLYQAIMQEIAALQSDPVGVLDRWRARDVTGGREVRVGGTVGVADGIDADGALRVRTQTGTVSVRSGEVEWVGGKD